MNQGSFLKNTRFATAHDHVVTGKARTRVLVIHDGTDRRDATVKTTFGGFRLGTEEAVQLEVCCTWRPVRLEGSSEQAVGHTRQYGPPRCKSVLSARCTARTVWQLDQCAKAYGNTSRKMATVQSRWSSRACTKEVGSESSRNVVKPKFTTDFLEAVVREGTDELTLRADEGRYDGHLHRRRGGGRQHVGAPLVDEIGTPSARPFSKVQAVKCKKSVENEKANALWSLKEAKDKGIDFYDLGSVQKSQTRPHVRLDLWAIHLWSPPAALADALKRTERRCGPAQSSATSEL